jgi:RNA polymerase sigma factor (sigma-70 family)
VTESSGDETRDLIERLVADDPAALELVYALYGARCNAVAYRVLQNEDSARDAVQEALLSLWRHRHGLVVRTAGLLPWLTVVSRNAAIGILRSEGSRIQREARVLTPVRDHASADPVNVVSARNDANEVRFALQQLPLEQQQVVELAYFKYLTMAQIAEQTATPVGTVKRRVQLALRRLARIMTEAAL